MGGIMETSSPPRWFLAQLPARFTARALTKIWQCRGVAVSGFGSGIVPTLW
jgi:hypothetical protein